MSLYKKYRQQTLAEMKGNAALISQMSDYGFSAAVSKVVPKL